MRSTLKKATMALMAFAAIAMTTSCNKDSDSGDTRPVNEQLAGTYTGTTTVMMNGVDLGMPATKAVIKIEKSGDKAKLTLVDSDYQDMLQGAVVSVDGISVAGDAKKYTLSGNGKTNVGGIEVPVTISGSGPLVGMIIKIGVVMTEKMSVEVVFTGTEWKE